MPTNINVVRITKLSSPRLYFHPFRTVLVFDMQPRTSDYNMVGRREFTAPQLVRKGKKDKLKKYSRRLRCHYILYDSFAITQDNGINTFSSNLPLRGREFLIGAIWRF